MAEEESPFLGIDRILNALTMERIRPWVLRFWQVLLEYPDVLHWNSKRRVGLRKQSGLVFALVIAAEPTFGRRLGRHCDPRRKRPAIALRGHKIPRARKQDGARHRLRLGDVGRHARALRLAGNGDPAPVRSAIDEIGAPFLFRGLLVKIREQLHQSVDNRFRTGTKMERLSRQWRSELE